MVPGGWQLEEVSSLGDPWLVTNASKFHTEGTGIPA